MYDSILQDIGVQSKDFEGSLTGFAQHFKCSDSSHGKIVMPESMVVSEKLDAIQRDKQKEKHSAQETSVDPHARQHEHAQEQYRDVKQAVQQREDEYLKGALHMSRIDLDQQIHLMREIEKAHKGKQQNAPDNQPFVNPNPNKRRDRYDVIPGPADSSSRPPHQQPSPHPSSGGPNKQDTQPSTGTSSARGRMHVYEPLERTRRDLLKMRDQRGIQDEYLLGLHSEHGGGSNVPLQQQRSVPGSGATDDHLDLQQISQQQNDPRNHPLYNNIPGLDGMSNQEFQTLEEWCPAYTPNLHHQQEQQVQDAQQEAMHGAQQLLQPIPGIASTHLPYDGAHPSSTHLPHGVGPQETILHSFSVGSTVQLMSDPPRYGVIQWIGTLPGIEGHIAGVELVSSKIPYNNFKFFLLYPISNILLPLADNCGTYYRKSQWMAVMMECGMEYNTSPVVMNMVSSALSPPLRQTKDLLNLWLLLSIVSFTQKVHSRVV